jgi:hypothetical protein|nr:MAG TPA: hypothetical protein [Caudoviricetes sp.]
MTLTRLQKFCKWYPVIVKSMRSDRGLIALHYALKNNKDVKTILFALSADNSLPWVKYLQGDLGAILDYYDNYQDKLYRRRCKAIRGDVLRNELFIESFV